ncbi:hypothetical protein LXL04_003718 [Taraxacum kok-saghyz]
MVMNGKKAYMWLEASGDVKGNGFASTWIWIWNWWEPAVPELELVQPDPVPNPKIWDLVIPVPVPNLKIWDLVPAGYLVSGQKLSNGIAALLQSSSVHLHFFSSSPSNASVFISSSGFISSSPSNASAFRHLSVSGHQQFGLPQFGSPHRTLLLRSRSAFRSSAVPIDLMHSSATSSVMEEQPTDRESEVEQQKDPEVKDKRKGEVWHKFDVGRDPKTHKITKASCKFCSIALKVTTNTAVPVSTVASELAFSTSGRVVDDFRSNLGVKTVEALICTQDWLRASNVCIDLEQLLEDVEKYEKYIGDTIDEAIVYVVKRQKRPVPVPTSSDQVQFQFQKFRIWSDQFQFQIPKPGIRQFQFQIQILKNRPSTWFAHP